MKVFRRGAESPQKADNDPLPPQPAPERAPQPPPAPQKISLSAEQKRILAEPIDPHVDQILQEIYANKIVAEQALNAHRMIDPSKNDSHKRHIAQDKDGFWRIVPGPIPEAPISLLDAL